MENIEVNAKENPVLQQIAYIAAEVAKLPALIAEVASIKESLLLLSGRIQAVKTCKETQTVSEDAVVADTEKPAGILVPNVINQDLRVEKEEENHEDSTATKVSKEDLNGLHTDLTGLRESKPLPAHSYTLDRKRKRRPTNDIKAEWLGKALQENIVTLVENMQFSTSGLGDLLVGNDCLSGDECAALYSLNPKDQIRNTIRLMKGRSFDVLKKFLKCVKTFHPDISQEIWKSFAVKKNNRTCERLCIFCKLKRAIDVRYIADFFWSVEGISDDVYADVVSHTRNNISDDVKWEELAMAINSSDSKKILKTVINALERKGYYSHLIPYLKRETKLACRCFDLKGLRVEFSIPVETTDDERSTLSPLSSVEDDQFPSLPDGQMYSSENSIDMDEDARRLALRAHLSNKVFDTQNCMVLADIAKDSGPPYQRIRSHSFGKGRKFPSRMTQRRSSCFS